MACCRRSASVCVKPNAAPRRNALLPIEEAIVLSLAWAWRQGLRLAVESEELRHQSQQLLSFLASMKSQRVELAARRFQLKQEDPSPSFGPSLTGSRV
jgi:hypothetical protein